MPVIEKTFIIIAIVSFVDALLDKWLIYRKLFDFGAKNTKTRFIYDLMSCRFCMTFHLAWICCVFLGFFIGFDVQLIAVPFLASGIIKLIEK